MSETELDPATLDAGSWGTLEAPAFVPEPVPEPEPERKRAEKKIYEGMITFGVKTELGHGELGTLLQQAMQDLIALDYGHVLVTLRHCSESDAQHSQLATLAPQLVSASHSARYRILVILRQEAERQMLKDRHTAELQALEMEETIAGGKGLR
jgi:hypothetical protein